MATRTVSNAGGNWNAVGTWTGGVVPITGDDINFTATSGNLTVNVASAVLVGVNLTNYVGTITFNNVINTSGVLNLGAGLYTQAGASGITLNGTATLTSGGVTWSRTLTFGGTSQTYTLVGDWTSTGLITFSGSGTTTFTNNTLNINGGLTQTTAGTYSGTTAIVFGGTGTWSNSSTGIIRNNLTFNSGANTVNISGNIYYNTGTITYTSGTIDTTGSTLTIALATTLNTNGITWNNITTTTTLAITLGSNLTLTGTLTIGTGTTSFVLGGFNLISTNANLTINTSGTFTMPTNQTFKTLTITGSATINTNTLTITENLTVNNSLTGTTNIIYGGTGTWTSLSSSALINSVFTINTAGTLTISGTVYKGSGLFTYTAGAINDTAGIVSIQSLTLNISGFTFRKLLANGPITLNSNINATTFGTWGNSATSFTLGGFSINFTNLELGNTNTTFLPTNWTAQNVELVNITTSTLTNNSITITGNLIQSGAGLYSGTTTFTYSVPALATGTWSRTGIGRLQNNLTINSAGTIDFTGGNIGGGIFTYTAGTVNVQVGSTLYNSSGSTTFNGAGITWYNVVFGAVSSNASVGNVTLNTQLICLGTLTLQLSITTFLGTDGTFDTYDFVLGSDGTTLRTTQLVSTKTYRVRQSFTCTQATNIGQILLRSTIGGSQAIFTLDSGATIDVGFVNATDIDSSLGRPIYSYKGVFTNTLNWGLLPVDNTRSGRFVYA